MQNHPSRRREELEAALRPLLTFQGLPAPRYAVVIPLVCTDRGVELLVEVRAAGISQSGDPCFPGGHIDAGETPAEAALRELSEELGIHAEPNRLLGQLPTVHTYLGSRADVFVCTVSEKDADTMTPNPREVDRVLRVPLSFLLADPSAPDYTVDGSVIWGMTAGAIHHLLSAWSRLPRQLQEAFSRPI